ncbi:adenylyl cyclase related protein [Pyrococcus sp. NA2]|uniref:class IV adenylate cyclase n=1 Tax=Pyrococcus sp. (strain NA2) TaxID=342949 RepID=UPI000209A9D6|nr:class IV adenylate cyclase [Pyrococcus sp. NA2]AEC51334.1 adenylyl cyclase related protein [Pyrococcus sp. NA2]
MYEVELKGYANDEIFKRVRERFEFIRKEVHEDIYYQHPCRDFSKTDEALRIRIKKFNGHYEVFLTYKGPKIDERSKTRLEIEIEISEPEKYFKLLEELGFREVLRIVKTREKYYVSKGITITLDEVEGLGKFVEIETLAKEREEIPGIVNKLEKILRDLGVNTFERRSYLELLLERSQKSQRT